MNRRLSEQQIREIGRQLLERQPGATVRQLQAELRHQVGAVGRASRVLAIWHSLQPDQHAEHADPALQLRCRSAESEALTAREALVRSEQRALRSEQREVAQQDHWANEIHALRTEVQQLRAERVQQQQVHQLIEVLRRERTQLLSRVLELESERGAAASAATLKAP